MAKGNEIRKKCTEENSSQFSLWQDFPGHKCSSRALWLFLDAGSLSTRGLRGPVAQFTVMTAILYCGWRLVLLLPTRIDCIHVLQAAGKLKQRWPGLNSKLLALWQEILQVKAVSFCNCSSSSLISAVVTYKL